jgi:EpsI family protein
MTGRLLAMAACFAATSIVLARAERQEIPPLRRPLSELPLTLGAWQGRVEPPFERAIVEVLGVDDYTLRSYRTQERSPRVGLYVGYHEEQRQGDTIHSPLNCLPGAGWTPVESRRIVLEVPDGAGGVRPIEVNRVVIERGLDRNLVLYWYQSHGRVVASEYWGKIYTVVDAIRLNRTEAALVRVTVPFDRDTAGASDAAEAAAAGFVRTLFPALSEHLPV